MNAGATFQCAMDITISKEKDKFMVIYLDDITVFSKSDEDHIRHLEHVFQKSKKFGVSLNPKKSNFSLEEGKLLGNIISKEGIKIDPNRVEAIQKLIYPGPKRKYGLLLVKSIFFQESFPTLQR